MISVQTNISVFSGLKYSPFKAKGQVMNKMNMLNSSVKNEVSLFSSKAKIDTKQNLNDQNAIFHFNQLSNDDKASLLYNGSSISELSFDEANELISDDGFFGVTKTSQRIIDFVIIGAGDDIDRLRAGREGVLRGFAAAEKVWGGSLPDICCQTIDKTIQAIDDRIAELGGNIMEITT